MLGELLAACGRYAGELGCAEQLAAIPALAAEPGHQRQRLLAGVHQGEAVGPGLGLLVSALASEFAAPVDTRDAA